MNNEVIKNNNLYFIKGLSYSDNKIVLDSLQKDKSIISIEGDYLSVLEDIISINILNNKKVLIVTKKDNKITFNNNTLNLIKLNTKDIHNLDINNLVIEKIQLALNNKSNLILSKMNLLSREIDKKIDLLKEINSFFIDLDKSGLTKLDMYNMSNSKIGKCDSRYEYYKTFMEKKPFMEYSYKDVKDSINSLLENDTSTNYNKYKRFSNNKSFDKIKRDLNIKDINLYLNNIEDILKDRSNIEIKLNKTKYTNDFIEAVIVNKKLSLNDLKALTSTINTKYNHYLIDDNFKYKKPNPLYWIKKKGYLKKLEENKSKYIKEEDIIYNNLESNYIIVNNYLNTLDFLNNVLNNVEYENLILKLLNEEGIEDSLKDIKKTLENYKTFIIIKTNLTSLSPIEEEILNYCYSNLNVKNQTNDLLKFIPELYIYSKIEDVETSNNDKLHYYTDYEIILNEIYINLLKKKELLSNAASNMYYKCLNNFIKDKDLEDINNSTTLENTLSEITLESKLLLSENLITNMYPCVICNEEEANVYLNSNECPYNSVILINTSIDYILQKDIDKIKVINEEDYIFNIKSLKKDKDCIKNEILKDIISHLTKLGYSIERNVMLYGYLIDILVYNRNTNEVILCIECDYNVYTNEFTVEKDDVFKKLVFEEKGIRYIRLWSRDWWKDRRYEINKITSILDNNI
ncbi:hypothetical protein [Clostridium sp.]|uniref:hypothetical protein n=1 Tax=Clostridium sp. TaxID=1506 RepID=UPI003F3590F5